MRNKDSHSVMNALFVPATKISVILVSFFSLHTVHAEDPQTLAQLELPVCSVTASGGHLDFGKSSRGQLQELQGGLSAGSKTLTLNADCTLGRVMRLQINGLARGTTFSWGQADSTLKVHIRQVILDGTAVQLQKIGHNRERSGENSDRLQLLPGDTFQPVRGNQPVSGKHLTAMLEIEPIIGDKDSRPVQQMMSETSINVALVP
ncbi:TPA: hypothetical protein ACXRUV_005095 [Klebsiella quasipneumoniae subsp. similipneumoniae]